MVADGAGSRLRAALFPGHPGLEGSGEYAARALAPAGLGRRAGAGRAARPPHRRAVRLHAAGRRPDLLVRHLGGIADAVPADPAARLAALRARHADWHPTVGALLAATDPAAVHVTETVRLVAPLPALAVGRSPCSATPPTR